MLKKIHSVIYYVVSSLIFMMATDAFASEMGYASYYSDRFQGRKTASGEQYDRNKLTAAHRTLPIGSKVEVTNLKNQTSVIVTINDRGPYVGNRALDLSYAAAKELGLVASGVAAVTFDVLKPKKDNDFEKVIPLEYAPGILGQAKSEEEVIEAEEELVVTEKNSDAANTSVKTDKTVKNHHKHSSKKVATDEKATSSDKTAKSGKDKDHKDDSSKKAKSVDEKSTKDSKSKKHEDADAKKSAKSSKHKDSDKDESKKSDEPKKSDKTKKGNKSDKESSKNSKSKKAKDKN